MNFKNIFEEIDRIGEIVEIKDLDNYSNFEKFFYLINQFETYEKFCEFMKIMCSIPTVEQVCKLTHQNENLNLFEELKTYGYFNLLDTVQKYHLFVEACSHDSIDIAMLIFSTSIDLEGVKEFMSNYLVQVGTTTEYIIFRKIWEKNIIVFNQEEIEEMGICILKTSNIEFIEWFCSLNLIDFNNNKIKNKIGFDVLDKASNYNDYKSAIFICSQYLLNKSK